MRQIVVKINEKGQVFIENTTNFEGENNATKLLFEIPKSWNSLNKYLDAIYTNQSGVEQKIQFPPLNEVDGEIAFLVPQVLTFSKIVGFQFLVKNTTGDIIQNSDVFNLFFKKSILADPGSVPENQDIINWLNVFVNLLDGRIDDTVQFVFDQDELIKEEFRARFDADEEYYQNSIDILQSFVNDENANLTNLINQVKDDIINGAPAAFDTLKEIADIFQNDPNLVATILNTLANKVDKVAGKGLSANDLTSELKAAYDSAVSNNHTHSNKAVLDLITDLVKAGYDTAASKAHEHTDLATLNALTAIWKLAVDDVVSRLVAKWMGTDIALGQIGLTHLTEALQQLIGSNNTITNYADNVTLESYVENLISKMRIKDLGVTNSKIANSTIDVTTKLLWSWGEDKKGYQTDGISGYLSSGFVGLVNAFCFWIYPTENNKGILNFGTNLTVSISSGNAIVLGSSITNATVNVNTFTTTALTLNKWNFVAISCDAFTATTFEYGKTTTHVAGKISNLLLFNRPLVAADYFNFFNNGIANNTVNYTDKSANNLEKTTNGDFGSATGWILSSTFTISGGKLNCISDGSYQYCNSNILVVGRSYKIVAICSDYTSGSIRFGNSGASSNIINAIGTYTFTFIASASLFYISRNTACDLKLDSISVIQIGCILELKGENSGTLNVIDSSGNGNHATVNGGLTLIEKPLIQKAWTGNFTTNIASGTANKDMAIPDGYMVEMITLRNTLTAGNITNFQAILNPASDNDTLISAKTINNGKTRKFAQLGDCVVDNANNMTLRFNCTGNGTGGIDIMVLLRRKD